MLEGTRKFWFLLALLLTTLAPIAFFITLGQIEIPGSGLGGIRTVLLFLGTAHVPATLFFYTDKEFSGIIRAHRRRYIYFPLALSIGTGLLLAFSNTSVQTFILLGFWGWQAFHYGRQNLGIYSFVSIAQRAKAATSTEKLAIDLGTVCGILGTFKILGMDASPAYLQGVLELLYQIGKFGLIAVFAFGVFVYVWHIRQTSVLKTIFFFTLILFFLPVYLSGNLNGTGFSYAIAHGLQYIVFMTVVSVNAKPVTASASFSYRGVMILLTFILLVGFIFYRASDLRDIELVRANLVLTRSVDFVIGAILGATMAHFVIDAGAWRLSQTAQRTYMSRRFGFLLSASPSANKTSPI